MRLIKISFVIIGAKIGAGFASGKEIFEYFAKYGVYSLFFVIPMFVFFLLVHFYLLKIWLKKKRLQHKEFKQTTIKKCNVIWKRY